ncbi:MAG TPA: hypothetical protein VNI20_11955, partial [Fimbriimonadaceae bacterium]|nr:hypothetical protein [Fimbriimonadaceae bacterium]
ADPAKCSKDTPTYSGRFSVFGHAECAGDEGHCQVTPDRRRFDDRPSHALTKAFRRIPITRHLKKACEKSNELTVTLIASCDSGFDGFEGERLLQYDGLQIVAR